MKKFLKNPQNVIIAFLVMVIAIGGTAMGTGAWFTDTNQTADNSLQFGTIDITDSLVTDDILNITARTTGDTTDIMPGDTLDIVFTLQNVVDSGTSATNPPSEDAWVRVTVEVTGLDATAAKIDNIGGTEFVDPSADHENVLYYDLQDSAAIVCTYKLTLAGGSFNNDFQDDPVSVTITVDAIQQANIYGDAGTTIPTTEAHMDYVFSTYVADFTSNGTAVHDDE